MQTRPSPTQLLVVLLLSTLTLWSYSSTRRVLISHSAQSIPFNERDLYTSPSTPVVQALTLNYRSFAASLRWVAGLVYFGDWRLSKHHGPPQHLNAYAADVAALDPHFFTIYEWFNATYISSRLPNVSYRDLKIVEAFMEQGMERFPTRHELPYTTGLLSIGYSNERTSEERLDEYRRGIKHLQRCAQLRDCHDTAPFMVAYYYRKVREYEERISGKAPDPASIEEERRFYAELYRQTMEPEQREKLAGKLRDMGMTPDELRALDGDQIERLRRAYEAERAYLPLDLWAQVVYPTSDDLLLTAPLATPVTP